MGVLIYVDIKDMENLEVLMRKLDLIHKRFESKEIFTTQFYMQLKDGSIVTLEEYENNLVSQTNE